MTSVEVCKKHSFKWNYLLVVESLYKLSVVVNLWY